MKTYTEQEVKDIITYVVEKVTLFRAIHRVDRVSDSTYETMFCDISDYCGGELSKLDLSEELSEFIDELS